MGTRSLTKVIDDGQTYVTVSHSYPAGYDKPGRRTRKKLYEGDVKGFHSFCKRDQS